jgi:TPR repeat protein
MIRQAHMIAADSLRFKIPVGNHMVFAYEVLSCTSLVMLQISKSAKSEFELAYDMAYGKAKSTSIAWKKLLALWLSSAQKGHPRAMFYVAVCYDLGHGTKKNLRLAFDWYMKAAKLKHPDSQYNIGFFYSIGEEVKRDHAKKVYWYKKAANAGIIDAQRDLGYAFFYGLGTPKSHTKAVYWYKKAAKQNDSKALFNLGLCYKHGDGVSKSVRWARYYFSKAATLGHKDARTQLRSL